jgi:hypothetical protein
MNIESTEIKPGIVQVETTSERGFTSEEIAEHCLEKIVRISDSAPPVIKNQALAFKKELRFVLVHYMQEAIKSDRTTVYNALLQAGQKDLAEAIRRF